MTYPICEYEFDLEDPKIPGYSLMEVDVYAWASPERTGVQSHRLSIRKNMRTGAFELYRRFNVPVAEAVPGLIAATHLDTGKEQVVASGSIASVCKAANHAYEEAHGHHSPGWEDVPCVHDGARKTTSSSCPKAYPTQRYHPGR